MTNVLVTGCTGFIGSNLTQRLVDEGHNVYGLVRHASRRDLKPLDPVLDRMHLIEGDLTQYHSVGSAISTAKPQFIFHLGALTPVRLSFEYPFTYLSTNVNGTVNLVHAISENCPKARLIFASTAEVYGWQKRRKPFREDSPLNPASPYAVSKEAADSYIKMAMKVYGLRATILRPNNTYGRKGERNFFTEYLVSTMLSGKTCHVGAPDSVRDYMFVDDHVNAYILSMKSDRAIGKVFNVSPGNPITNRELTETVSGLLGFTGEIVYESYPPGYPQRPAIWDPDYLVLDSSKIRKILDWHPSVSLKEGLARTIDTWRKMSV
jgi:nucleoside-diphosphate-sugar epimerase